jgi:hypothetical protein
LSSNKTVIALKNTAPNLGQVADFMFERSNKEKMILESKSSFMEDTNNPSGVKTTLKVALENQVENWLGQSSLGASKGYATYSCIRESGNSVPSALIFVDPEKTNLMEERSSWTRRQNYAAWLRAMGLMDISRKLLEDSSHDLKDVQFLVFEVQNRHFAYYAPDLSSPNWHWLWTTMLFGLEIGALEAISQALAGNDEKLLHYEGVKQAFDAHDEPANLSVFSDGSIFGPAWEFQRSVYTKTFML